MPVLTSSLLTRQPSDRDDRADATSDLLAKKGKATATRSRSYDHKDMFEPALGATAPPSDADEFGSWLKYEGSSPVPTAQTKAVSDEDLPTSWFKYEIKPVASLLGATEKLRSKASIQLPEPEQAAETPEPTTEPAAQIGQEVFDHGSSEPAEARCAVDATPVGLEEAPAETPQLPASSPWSSSPDAVPPSTSLFVEDERVVTQNERGDEQVDAQAAPERATDLAERDDAEAPPEGEVATPPIESRGTPDGDLSVLFADAEPTKSSSLTELPPNPEPSSATATPAVATSAEPSPEPFSDATTEPASLRSASTETLKPIAAGLSHGRKIRSKATLARLAELLEKVLSTRRAIASSAAPATAVDVQPSLPAVAIPEGAPNEAPALSHPKAMPPAVETKPAISEHAFAGNLAAPIAEAEGVPDVAVERVTMPAEPDLPEPSLVYPAADLDATASEPEVADHDVHAEAQEEDHTDTIAPEPDAEAGAPLHETDPVSPLKHWQTPHTATASQNETAHRLTEIAPDAESAVDHTDYQDEPISSRASQIHYLAAHEASKVERSASSSLEGFATPEPVPVAAEMRELADAEGTYPEAATPLETSKTFAAEDASTVIAEPETDLGVGSATAIAEPAPEQLVVDLAADAFASAAPISDADVTVSEDAASPRMENPGLVPDRPSGVALGSLDGVEAEAPPLETTATRAPEDWSTPPATEALPSEDQSLLELVPASPPVIDHARMDDNGVSIERLNGALRAPDVALDIEPPSASPAAKEAVQESLVPPEEPAPLERGVAASAAEEPATPVVASASVEPTNVSSSDTVADVSAPPPTDIPVALFRTEPIAADLMTAAHLDDEQMEDPADDIDRDPSAMVPVSSGVTQSEAPAEEPAIPLEALVEPNPPAPEVSSADDTQRDTQIEHNSTSAEETDPTAAASPNELFAREREQDSNCAVAVPAEELPPLATEIDPPQSVTSAVVVPPFPINEPASEVPAPTAPVPSMTTPAESARARPTKPVDPEKAARDALTSGLAEMIHDVLSTTQFASKAMKPARYAPVLPEGGSPGGEEFVVQLTPNPAALRPRLGRMERAIAFASVGMMIVVGYFALSLWHDQGDVVAVPARAAIAVPSREWNERARDLTRALGAMAVDGTPGSRAGAATGPLAGSSSKATGP